MHGAAHYAEQNERETETWGFQRILSFSHELPEAYGCQFWDSSSLKPAYSGWGELVEKHQDCFAYQVFSVLSLSWESHKFLSTL